MKTKVYTKCSLTLVVIIFLTTSLFAQKPGPVTITGPLDPITLLPATIGTAPITGAIYTTQAGAVGGYYWTVSSSGIITAGQGTNSITVNWNTPPQPIATGQQTVSVYVGITALPAPPVPPPSAVLIINFYPFVGPINPLTIPQFVDPLPHFAAGLRVDAKAGGSLIIKTVPVRQIALSTGTVLSTGTIAPPGPTPPLPTAPGMGNYAAYAISKDNGATFGPAMWPAQTIEAQVGKELKVWYQNNLIGAKYSDFNILSDQTLMMNGFPQNGNIYLDPYNGDIPMVVHLHGGEMPSGSDGGPTAWFMPTGNPIKGPGYPVNNSGISTYPNQQESGTLWYHPHDQGLTRINVYTGLAGFYFLRGPVEEAAKLPGWSGDDKVREIQPAGKQPTFNGANTYLPEIEIGIQDRMFNTKGELYWPVTPTNPDIHPFWTPEFFGDVMVVNGKSWPYLSVAPRKYRFRMLDGCNARFLNMWLQDLATKTAAPAITVIGSDGAFLDIPAVLDPAKGQTLTMAPGERYDVIIDFTGLAGKVFTLMNNANAPYPTGTPVLPGLTDRIMQFVVNGQMVSATVPTSAGTDKSLLPANVRATAPMVKLTNFAGALSAGVVPAVKRQIILNEVATVGGPVQVLFNNSHFDAASTIPGAPLQFSAPTEIPKEGTTELVTIINTTVDAHPIHIHLTQWQLVSRQAFNVQQYLAAYKAAWAAVVPAVPQFPVGLGYPGGGGSPMPYTTLNADGAIGGNPALTPFLTGVVKPADPQERVWKDNIKSIPGEVATYIVRYAPTDRPINAAPVDLLYPFDPSDGPGYVWHCHIIDHEDMDMMRPLMVTPSAERFFRIATQPVPAIACVGDKVSYSVKSVALGPNLITYQWQVSADAGVTWTNLVDGAEYSGSLSSSLSINPVPITFNAFQYRCVVSHVPDVPLTSNAVSLTVNTCSVSGIVQYNNLPPMLPAPVANVVVSVNGLQSLPTGIDGLYTVNNVTSGTYPVIITSAPAAGGVNATDAGSLNSWIAAPVAIPSVRLLSADADNNLLINTTDALSIQNRFVTDIPYLKPWVFANATGSGTVVPAPMSVQINGASVPGFNILGMSTGDFNGSYDPAALLSSVSLVPSGLTVAVPGGKSFDLTLNSLANITFGAVSLILNVPANLVTVTNVSIAGSSIPVSWKVTGDMLRIGWNSPTLTKVLAGKPLVVITMMPAPSSLIQTLQVSLVQDPLNEVADGLFKPILTSLTADNVAISATAAVLQVAAFPNPATTSTTITYFLPVDGTVTLDIINSLGAVVKSVVPATVQTAGSYTIANYSLVPLIKGTYTIRLNLAPTVVGPLQTTTLKLLIK